MKKLFSAISMLICSLCICFVFSACGEAKATKIAIKEGSVETAIEVNQTLDLSNLVVVVTYDNGETEDVAKNDEMEISGIDTSTTGYKTLTVEYLNLSGSITIRVVNNIEETYDVIGFEKPASVSLYETNSSATGTRYAFTQTGKSYKVGDDNAFVFKPIITALSPEDDIVTLDYIACNFDLQVKNGSAFESVANKESVVTFNNQTFGFDFDSTAVGNTYKIVLTPSEHDLDEISFVVEVVDGYNVHNTKELSVLDNNSKTKTIWADFKTANNIPQNINPASVVLHNNLSLSMNDVPAGYKYNQGDADSTAELVGTLRNRKSLYTRDTASNTTFNIHGNYFTIDAASIALVDIEELQKIDPDAEAFGHSSLFSFGGDNHDNPETLQGNVIIENVKLLGNANRTENTDLVGGLIMVLNSANELTINNTVTMSFQTNLVSTDNEDNWEITSTISNSKWYDSFSNMCYYYGVKNNNIINSVLEGAGGPVLNAVHVDPADNPNSNYAEITVVNSKVETWVNGTEAWFAYNSATPIATELFAMDALIKQSSTWAKTDGVIANAKTFTQNGKANFMGMIAANNQLTNTSPVKGSITIKNANDETVFVYTMSDNIMMDQIVTSINAVQAGVAYQLPFFATNNMVQTITVDSKMAPNGIGTLTTPIYTSGTASSLTQQQIAMINAFYSGDYIGIYANGVPTIGVLAGYFNA